MTFEEIYAVDRSNMYALLKGFPAQARSAVGIGKALRPAAALRGLDRIVLCGLGGSAIGGDLLRSYGSDLLRVPFFVNRTYRLPKFVDRRTLVVISSYSGGTEETLAAYREAMARKARILCITSGGAAARTARARRHALITIPGGLPPRAALGFSFFPLLLALDHLGYFPPQARPIAETLRLLEEKTALYADPDPAANPALRLAERLRGRLTVVYSSAERFDAVATRWRGQIAENAKALAFGHVVPEMNHNELVGWKALTDAMRGMNVLFLRDREDHRRVAIRMDISKEIIAAHGPQITDIWSDGTSRLARMFSLISLGDWLSYYLAILHREDPTPVAVIDHLKTELGKVRG